MFKRTFYQMMFKFQLGTHDGCAGCVLAIPASVWDSWQPHLGKPDVVREKDGTYSLFKGKAERPERVPAWIYVFDTGAGQAHGPAALIDHMVIATDAPSVSHFALDVAPAEAIGNIDSPRGMMFLLRKRLNSLWPELAETLPMAEGGTAKAPRKRKKPEG